jgi:hypothetical protein
MGPCRCIFSWRAVSPKVNVLRDNWRALQRGRRKPDDHEPHFALQQNAQQVKFTF